MQTIIHNLEQTKQLAIEFADTLRVGDIVLLSGDLGAGKTTFTKGFAKGFGVADIITSPTFTIMNEYCGIKHNLFHFDMYRLNGADEAYALGFEEYFEVNNLKGICIVEWAINVKGLINKPYFEISFEKLDDNSRKITIKEIQ